MTYNEMKDAINEAESILRKADWCATDIAGILVGRLHKVKNGETLESLKKELKNYNIHTGCWKDS